MRSFFGLSRTSGQDRHPRWLAALLAALLLAFVENATVSSLAMVERAAGHGAELAPADNRPHDLIRPEVQLQAVKPESRGFPQSNGDGLILGAVPAVPVPETAGPPRPCVTPSGIDRTCGTARARAPPLHETIG